MKPTLKQPYIQKVLKSISAKDTLFQTFSETYLSRFSEYVLSQLPLADIRTILDMDWEFIQSWQGNSTPKISLQNVSVLHSSHDRGTVVQILTANIPFVADSILTELRRQKLDINFVLKYSFNADRQNNKITSIQTSPEHASDMLLHIELRQHVPLTTLDQIEQAFLSIIKQITQAVTDFALMQKMLQDTAPLLSTQGHTQEANFINWLATDHFIFLGALHIHKSNIQNTFGVFKDSLNYQSITEELINTSSTNTNSIWLHKPSYSTTVDRNEPLDIIRIKVAADEEVVFIGLLTYAARSTPFAQIPYVKTKIEAIESNLKLSSEPQLSIDAPSVISQLPLIEVINSNTDSLTQICQNILNHRSKYVVLMHDRFDENLKQTYILIFANQEKLTKQHQETIRNIFTKTTNADVLYQDTYLIDNNLNCLYIVLKHSTDITSISETLIKKISEATLSWEDTFRSELIKKVGLIEADILHRKYVYTFNAKFKSHYTPLIAADDVLQIENVLSNHSEIEVSAHENVDSDAHNTDATFHLRIFKTNSPLLLSDTFAMLSSLDLALLSEVAHEINLPEGHSLWVHDLKVSKKSKLDLSAIEPQLKELSTKVLLGQHTCDKLNSLAITEGLTHRQIILIKTLLAYLKQIQFPFGGSYTRDIILRNTSLTYLVVKLFETKFAPNIQPEERLKQIEVLTSNFNQQLKDLTSEDEDKLFRQLYNLVTCILRTNYYIEATEGVFKPYISIKIESGNIIDIPQPAPMVEIFVYSKEFEAVHLRGGKVARGGIRWSDRGEDYRTEVLGLTKAQNTKNAVIVPRGAKGGFYVKDLTASKEKGVECYKNMVRAFLDITDNIIHDSPTRPKNVVCYDELDPYFVVAADKGTATFSDTANAIAAEYNFWLKDAFASGGSAGYDHKKMAITSKGAWESVKHHCKEVLNLNPETDVITAIGIGDMSGDVFGNGMLCSKTIQLKSAFNHKHIFIDPTPNPEQSYAERLRLFNLPYSGWNDYSTTLLSKGGMIIERSSKIVELSDEAQLLLGLKEKTVKPSQIMRAILKLHVDLMWLGGIGTYIKASSETHEAVADRANDFIRINGNEVNARIIAEGANLGVTQLGRIEFELTQHGRINTDFIDNSGGVDCSDHEVNIKILLNKLVEKDILTLNNRNTLLKEMTPEIVQLVTANNQKQNLALSLAAHVCEKHTEEFGQLNTYLNKHAGLSNKIEYLPSPSDLLERKKLGSSFTRPELAIFISYTKNHLKNEILTHCDLTTSSATDYLTAYFPSHLLEYTEEMTHHPLKKEIISTQLANEIIDRLGVHFIYRLMQQTGSSITNIINAYLVTKKFFELSTIWEELDRAMPTLTLSERLDTLETIANNVYSACTWILNFSDPYMPVEAHVQKLNFFYEAVQPSELILSTPNVCPLNLTQNKSPLNKALFNMQLCLTTVYLSLNTTCLSPEELKTFEKVFYALHSRIPLDAIMNLLITLTQKQGYWQSLFILNTQIDLMRIHVDLTQAISVTILSKKISLEQILMTHATEINWLNQNVETYMTQTTVDASGITLLVRYLSHLANSITAQLEKEY